MQKIDYKIIPLQRNHFKEAKDVLLDAFTQRNEPLNKDSSPIGAALGMQFMLQLGISCNASLVAIETKTN